MTKIKITNDEFYILPIPDELELIELDYILERLNFIKKHLIDKSIVNLKPTEEGQIKPVDEKARPYIKSRYLFLKDRNLLIQAIKDFYFATPEEKLKFESKYGIDRATFSNKLYYWKVRYDIMPEEVGLIRFPNKEDLLKGGSRQDLFNSLRLQNGNTN